jgi:hypothetical protein
VLADALMKKGMKRRPAGLHGGDVLADALMKKGMKRRGAGARYNYNPTTLLTSFRAHAR